MNRKIVVVLIAMLCVTVLFTGCKNKGKNDDAQKDKDGRYITVINHTGKTINHIRVYVGKGTEIESMHVENPDEESRSIKVPDQYEDDDLFTVSLESVHKLKYVKKVEVEDTGRTEVVIEEKDKQSSGKDWKHILDDFFD